jgi:hypothetical protein
VGRCDAFARDVRWWLARGSVGSPAGFTPTQSNLPPDPVYQAAISALKGTEGNTIAGLDAAARGRAAEHTGYTEDPTTHAIAYDPNNPYSQAALLRKSYQQSKTGNTNSYAEQGQLLRRVAAERPERLDVQVQHRPTTS